ncbi:4-hydroxy-tetrahydrodipicolinate reductase [Legionella sp. W05-934-2]|uniref:4-hydroxy-tetrahydrodipicolinate reductase n=1 Tax=Legionella sp. W05-934-2 TaxID=1198649 RepID=UPI003462AD72
MSSKIRIIVNGANGKMGALACETLANDSQFDLVAQAGRQDNLGQLINAHQADVVLDLTRADCAWDNAQIIIQQGARPVIGTSGLTDEQINQLKKQCQALNLGALIVPNFSLGAVLMMHFAKLAAAHFSEVEIIEAHHQQKLDAPSGTAIKTAEMIAIARKVNPNQLDLKELVPGARGGLSHQIPIHSLRLPGIIARQTVEFGGVGETLTITHNSIDRQCFMPGVILACQSVMNLDGLMYGLESILLN